MNNLTAIKIGGSLSHLPGALAAVGQALAASATRQRIVVIPGGGPFADVVRTFDAAHALSHSAAHWMAILGMDQYAFALADKTPGSRVVEDSAGITTAHAAHLVPILAPSRWLRAADELPHRWEVTSDSLAAYIAMLLGAEDLVLVKPVGSGDALVDPYFSRALAAGTRWRVLGIEEIGTLPDVVADAR
ncbi:MAG: aspartate kinase [Gemmatimonadales bacterium]